MITTYTVIAPSTPGAQATILSRHTTLAAARRAARSIRADRRDLTYQDVVIFDERRRLRVEFAGPVR